MNHRESFQAVKWGAPERTRRHRQLIRGRIAGGGATVEVSSEVLACY
ncbi:hypothetical protein [Rhodococcus erythropolis]|nr:hypothetical protein [Rhodococcus erythropolis]